jgi:hypothetical protein
MHVLKLGAVKLWMTKRGIEESSLFEIRLHRLQQCVHILKGHARIVVVIHSRIVVLDVGCRPLN